MTKITSKLNSFIKKLLRNNYVKTKLIIFVSLWIKIMRITMSKCPHIYRLSAVPCLSIIWRICIPKSILKILSSTWKNLINGQKLFKKAWIILKDFLQFLIYVLLDNSKFLKISTLLSSQIKLSFHGNSKTCQEIILNKKQRILNHNNYKFCNSKNSIGINFLLINTKELSTDAFTNF